MSFTAIKETKHGREKTMNRDMMNQENEIAIEIEELEDKIAPQSSSSFLD